MNLNKKVAIPEISTHYIGIESEGNKMEDKPWKMNVDDYSDFLVLSDPKFAENLYLCRFSSDFQSLRRKIVKDIHRPLVQKAISENKQVLLGVLLDYEGEPWADEALNKK